MYIKMGSEKDGKDFHFCYGGSDETLTEEVIVNNWGYTKAAEGVYRHPLPNGREMVIYIEG